MPPTDSPLYAKEAHARGQDLLNFSQLAPGTAIRGGGLAIFVQQDGDRENSGICLQVSGPDEGKLVVWGPAAHVVPSTADSTLEAVDDYDVTLQKFISYREAARQLTRELQRLRIG